MAAAMMSVQQQQLPLQSKSGGGNFLKAEPEHRRVRIKGSARREQPDDISLTPSSEDPLRILAPGQKKLSTIESQRVLAVMEEAIKRLDGAVLIPTLVNSLDRYSVSLGAEMVAMVKEYDNLVKDYNSAYANLELQGKPPDLKEVSPSTEDLGPDSGKRKTDGTLSQGSSSSSLMGSGRPVRLEPLDKPAITAEERFQVIRGRLKHTVKCILRELRKNPSASSLLTSTLTSTTPGSGKPKNIMILQEEMSKLHSVLHEKLLTTHMEEARKLDHLKEVTERQLLAEQQILKLEAELNEEQRKKEELITKKNAEIKRLKSTIKGVVNLAEDRNRRVKVDAHNQQIQDKQNHESKASKLQEEIALLTKKLQDVVAENKEKEQSLRKRAFKRETEVENWIQKYDHEMGEKQDELELLEEEYVIETAQLKELEEKLGVLSVEYTAVIQEQEEARANAEELAQKMSQMAQAARVIQRSWRLYLEKKKAMKGKKKGKKGKGKGKKGKGKGKGKGKKKK